MPICVLDPGGHPSIWADARDMDRCTRYGPIHALILFTGTHPHSLYRCTPSTPPTTPVTCPSPNFACNSKTQVTQHPELIQTGMMLAVNCMRNCWTATSYTEYHRNGCTHAACSPGCRPLGSHSRLATIPSTTPRSLHRYKTLPAHRPGGITRYKTLPARPKTPILAHFPHAGRIFSRSRQ